METTISSLQDDLKEAQEQQESRISQLEIKEKEEEKEDTSTKPQIEALKTLLKEAQAKLTEKDNQLVAQKQEVELYILCVFSLSSHAWHTYIHTQQSEKVARLELEEQQKHPTKASLLLKDPDTMRLAIENLEMETTIESLESRLREAREALEKKEKEVEFFFVFFGGFEGIR